MANKKKGFMANVSTPNKISITVCFLLMGLGVYWVLFNSSKDDISMKSEGLVDVALNVSKSNIDQSSVNDDVELRSEVLDSIYKSDNEDRLNDAKNGESSYIARLDIENKERMSEQIDGDKGRVRHQESIDSILEIDSRVEINKRKVELSNQEKRLEEEVVQSSNENNSTARRREVDRVSGFDRKAFMATEMAGLANRTDNKDSLLQAASLISANNDKEINVKNNYLNSNKNNGGSASKNGGKRESMSERLSNNRYSSMVKVGKANKYKELNDLRAKNGGIVLCK